MNTFGMGGGQGPHDVALALLAAAADPKATAARLQELKQVEEHAMAARHQANLAENTARWALETAEKLNANAQKALTELATAKEQFAKDKQDLAERQARFADVETSTKALHAAAEADILGREAKLAELHNDVLDRRSKLLLREQALAQREAIHAANVQRLKAALPK